MNYCGTIQYSIFTVMTVSAEVKKVTKSTADLPDGEISIWLEPTG